MRSVTLLRHAKATEAASGGGDHARPLAQKGRDAARRVGLATAAAPAPDLVLCSTALRTRETWTAIAATWPALPEIRFDAALYLAEMAGLLEQLTMLDQSVGSVWLIGHNPGLHELAWHFASGSASRNRVADLRSHFPTAARIRFESDAARWSDLLETELRVAEFVPVA